MKSTLFIAPALLGAAFLLPVPRSAVAQTPTAPVAAQAAPSTGDLQAAQTLRAEFVITTTYPGTTFHDLQERGVVTLARPNKVRVEVSRFRRVSDHAPWESAGNGSVVVSDNETLWTLIQHPHGSQYRKEAAAPETPAKLLASLPPLQGFFAPVSAGEPERQARTGRGNRDVQITKWETNVSLAPTAFAFVLPPDALPLAPVQTRRAASVPPRSGGDSGKSGLLAVGETAPDFALRDANGKIVRLSDYKGKVVLLKFWATWCWPCRQSLPETQKLARAYPADAVVLMVDVWDSPKGFTTWASENEKTVAPNVRVLFDPAAQADANATANTFHVPATPTHYVIGRDGRIVGAFSGYDGPSPALEAAVQAAVHPAPAAKTASVR